MKLLLVDDDAFLRDMYATKFQEVGHEVTTAASGEEALTLLADLHPDVILLDMVMPGMGGIELLKKIKNMEVSSKCIVLSNQGESSDINAADGAGAVGYIVKAESIPSQVVQQVEELSK